jgi:hypothetical protein
MGESPKPAGELPTGTVGEAGTGDPTADEREGGRGISDFVRRAVSVGVGAAQRSRDDIMRAAGTEVRSWLERLNVHDELVKLLSKVSVELKAEIRFKARDEKDPKDPKTAVPETVTDPGSKPERPL